MASFVKRSHWRKQVKNRGGTTANLPAVRRKHYRSFTKGRQEPAAR